MNYFKSQSDKDNFIKSKGFLPNSREGNLYSNAFTQAQGAGEKFLNDFDFSSSKDFDFAGFNNARTSAFDNSFKGVQDNFNSGNYGNFQLNDDEFNTYRNNFFDSDDFLNRPEDQVGASVMTASQFYDPLDSGSLPQDDMLPSYLFGDSATAGMFDEYVKGQINPFAKAGFGSAGTFFDAAPDNFGSDLNTNAFDTVTSGNYGRQAGPDGILYTDDDEMNAPSLLDAGNAMNEEAFLDMLKKIELASGNNEEFKTNVYDLLSAEEGGMEFITNQLYNAYQAAINNREAGGIATADALKTALDGLFKTNKSSLDTNANTLKTNLNATLQTLGLDNTTARDALETALLGTLGTKKTAKDTAAKGVQDDIVTLLNDSKTTLGGLSSDLSEAQKANNLEEYMAITDTLRGDTLDALRAGQYGTQGATDKLLVDALTNAARDRQAVEGDINVEEALRNYTDNKELAEAALSTKVQKENREFENEVNLAEGKSDVANQADDQKYQDMRDSANMTFDIGNENSRRKDEIANNFAEQNLSVATQAEQTKSEIANIATDSRYDRYNQVSDRRASIRSEFVAERANLGIEFEEGIRNLKNEYAELVGSTPEETEGLFNLAEEMVALQALKGETDIKSKQDIYQALTTLLDKYLADPTSIAGDVASVQNQLENLDQDLVDKIDQMTAKYENVPAMVSLIEEVNSYDSYTNAEKADFLDIIDTLQASGAGFASTMSTTQPAVANLASPSANADASNAVGGGGGGYSDINFGATEILAGLNAISDGKNMDEVLKSFGGIKEGSDAGNFIDELYALFNRT